MSMRTLLRWLLVLLGVFILAQLLLVIWRWQPDWFRHPMGVAYATLWALAGLAGLSAALPRPQRWPSSLWERLPWLAGGILLGFVVPGLFSVGFSMLLAGSLFLLAAGLRTPRKRYALEAFLAALATTGVVLGVATILGG